VRELREQCEDEEFEHGDEVGRQPNIQQPLRGGVVECLQEADVAAWAKNNGSEVLDVIEEEGYTRILVRVSKTGV